MHTATSDSKLVASITAPLSVTLTIFVVAIALVLLLLAVKLYRQSRSRVLIPNSQHSCPEVVEMQLPNREGDGNSYDV